MASVSNSGDLRVPHRFRWVLVGVAGGLLILGAWRQLEASSLSARLEDLWMLVVPVGLLYEARLPALHMTDRALCLRRTVAGVAVGTTCTEWSEIQRVEVCAGGRRLELHLSDGRRLSSVEPGAIRLLLDEVVVRDIDVVP
jgi:hypothetical protein